MYQKILVPLDGSETAVCTLAHTRTIAQGCQVPEVTLLRVVEPLPTVYSTYGLAGDLLSGAQEKAQTEAKDYLSKQAEYLRKDGISVETALATGKAADEILDYASKNQTDLIIMCTHGTSGIHRWAMGSVADKVLRHSRVPVLLVPPAGSRSN